MTVRVGELGSGDFAERLRAGRLAIDAHPFIVRLKSDVPKALEDVRLMYADFPLADVDGFCDFHIEVRFEPGLRRWYKPLARFSYDGRDAFMPLPAQHAFTMIEWGLNWCVASHAHQYLVVHAAVLERNGRALLLPAPPGSGKSTLCAALTHRGWRLLSDELALCDMDTGLVHGMARPVNLKNASIPVIRGFEPAAVLTEPVPDTAKGTVALMRAPTAAVQRARQPARPAWVVLPRFQAGAPTQLLRHDRSRTLLLMADQSFNYSVHGERGFDALLRLVDQCQCFDFSYSRLDEAITCLNQLADGGPASPPAA